MQRTGHRLVRSFTRESQAFQDGSQHISTARQAATKKKSFMERQPGDDASHDAASGSSLNESWSAAPSPALTATTLDIVLRSKAWVALACIGSGFSGFSAFCQLHIWTRFPN